MACFCVVVFLTFSHLVCSLPLSGDVPIKQDSLSVNSHKRACSDFQCLMKLVHERPHMDKDNEVGKEMSETQSKDAIAEPLATSAAPPSSAQYPLKLMSRRVIEILLHKMALYKKQNVINDKTSTRNEDDKSSRRGSLAEQIRNINHMDVNQLAHLLHSMQGSIDAIHRQKPKTTATPLHLHNICCDIG